MRGVAFAVIALAHGGCHGPDVFACMADSDCTSATGTGTCEPTGYCAFADPSCSTDARYDDSAGMGLAGTCVPVGAGWWDPAWPVRMHLAIAVGALDLPVGYQVGVARDLDAAPCTGSRDGARIVWHTTELDRVIDEVGTDEWIWFRLQAPLPAASTSTDYFLYCGNPSPAPAPADATRVFDFFDNFDRTALGAAWQSSNTVVIAGGTLTLGGAGQADNAIQTTATWPAGTAVDVRTSIADPANAAASVGWQAGDGTMPPWIAWRTENPPSIRPAYASSPTDAAMFHGNDVAVDAAYHLYGIEYYGVAAAYRRDDAVVEHHLHATQVTPTALGVHLRNNTTTGTVSASFVRVRKAVDPPPVVTVGDPEAF